MAALISSVRGTAVGEFHSYLLCLLPFPLCLSPLSSPPSSSGWVAGTFSDSKSLAPSRAGSPFHSTERALTIIRAESGLTSCFDDICPSTVSFSLTLKGNWSILVISSVTTVGHSANRRVRCKSTSQVVRALKSIPAHFHI